MENTKPKKRIWLRVLCIVLAAIIVIVAALGITVWCVWSDEISTVASFTKLRDRNDDHNDGSIYRMDVKGGYYFDEYLASGGASSDSELINFITDHITRGLIDMTISETDIGCSSFIAKTASGDILFGRNYDFDKTNVCLTFTNPGDGRHASFSTVDLNYVGMDPDYDVEGLMNKITCLAAPYAPLDGINDAGVSCGIFMSYQGGEKETGTVATDQQDESKPNITSTTMLRMILDYADDVDEAVELVKNYNLHDSANTSFHYMIADASGRSAILEWVPAEGITDGGDNDGAARTLNVIYNDDPMYDELQTDALFNFQTITNFIITPGYYDNAEEDGPGYDRYTYINGELAKVGGVVADEEAAMDILQAVGRRTWDTDGLGVTVHSAVYNLTQKTVFWVGNENFGDSTATFRYSFETGELTRG